MDLIKLSPVVLEPLSKKDREKWVKALKPGDEVLYERSTGNRTPKFTIYRVSEVVRGKVKFTNGVEISRKGFNVDHLTTVVECIHPLEPCHREQIRRQDLLKGLRELKEWELLPTEALEKIWEMLKCAGVTCDGS